jgi:hypothetical protein
MHLVKNTVPSAARAKSPICSQHRRSEKNPSNFYLVDRTSLCGGVKTRFDTGFFMLVEKWVTGQ